MNHFPYLYSLEKEIKTILFQQYFFYSSEKEKIPARKLPVVDNSNSLQMDF